MTHDSREATPPPARRRPASLRERYLVLGAIGAIALLLGATAAQTVLNRLHTHSLSHAAELHQAHAEIRYIQNALWATALYTQARLVNPLDPVHDHTLPTLAATAAQVETAARTPWAASLHLAPDLDHVSASVSTLATTIRRIQAREASPTALYPAVSLMRQRIFPADVRARAAFRRLELASLMTPSPAQTLTTLNTLEAQWDRTITDFRISTAFRRMISPLPPGLAPHPDRHPPVSVTTDYQALMGPLAQLREIFRGRPGGATVTLLARAIHDWHGAYLVLSRMPASYGWRSDAPVFQRVVGPAFAQILNQVASAERQTEIDTDRRTADSVALIGSLASLLWLLAAIGLATIATGIVLLDRAVRGPMAKLASAMDAHARGAPPVALPTVHLQEPLALINAFSCMREEVTTREYRLRGVLDHAAEGILTFDDYGVIDGFNLAAENIFGYRADEVVGEPLTRLLPLPVGLSDNPMEEWLGQCLMARKSGGDIEVVGIHKEGRRVLLSLRLSRTEINRQPLYTGLVSDITSERAMLDQLRHDAEHDALTGLYNRAHFERELARAVERSQTRTHPATALVYIDLDNLKYINDTQGHAAGDRVILEVARTLERQTRPKDLLARFGGDEFMLLLTDVSPDSVHRVSESIRDTLAHTHVETLVGAAEVSASIGISLIGPRTRTLADALAQADVACQRAKQEGKNRAHLFDPADEAKVATMTLDLDWKRRIRRAIEEDHFVLAAQPVLSLKSGQISGHEILLRLRDPSGQMVPPMGFLPVAERFGLSAEIDRWVILRAIRWIAAHGDPSLRYSINLSGHTLTDLGIIPWIERQLARAAVAPARLVFELTETVAVSNLAHARVFLTGLRELGCNTALDDFGCGFSSFAYLKDLPVGIVKIDGRFVQHALDDPADQAILVAVNNVAHALHKETVAEFVENTPTIDLLRRFGIDGGQGYAIGQPLILPDTDFTQARKPG